MKRTRISMVSLIVAMAAVGCARINPASSSAAQDARAARTATPLEERLIGAWEMRVSGGAPLLVTFKRGEVVDVTEDDFPKDPLTISGTYQVDGDKVALKADTSKEMDLSTAMPVLKRFTTYTYSIKGGVLILLNPDGEEIRCEKP